MAYPVITPDDRPLATQAAAPPMVPPRRPIVGAALQDDADARMRASLDLLARNQRQLEEILARLDARDNR